MIIFTPSNHKTQGNDEMTNTNQIVNMKLTGINKKNGKREEIAGTYGLAYVDSKKELDMRAWFLKEVKSGDWDNYFTDFAIEVTRTTTELEVVA